MSPRAIEKWHSYAKSQDTAELEALLAEDVVFQSPVVHSPQKGKAITLLYLTAALHTLGNENFKYVGEWTSPTSAVLEFETVVDGITINGIDMIGWNDADQITSFKVMVRPLKAMNMLHAKMGEMLATMAPKK
ncbi:MAG: nuclear transport factor 2 family protein [Parvibaculaceae bacterium]